MLCLMALRVERATSNEPAVLAYLEQNVVRNALDIWNLGREDDRYQLHVCRMGGRVKAHLSIYRTPEANYVSLGGAEVAAEALLQLIPRKAALTVAPELRGLVTTSVGYDTIYPNDIMVIRRGEERAEKLQLAVRLAREHEIEYSSFGSSFNAPQAPPDWIRERLDNDIVFGAFSEGKLASVASVAAWLPQVAVILGVETKKEFRRRGLGLSVVSAAVQEALKRSESCSLFVRSDNLEAIRLYARLGFQKFGEELWVDIGTGIVP